MDKKLTETELELMNILWEIGEGGVRDVMAGLSTDRSLAYTSVSTILRILEKKDFVSSRKEGKSHIYSPCIEKNNYEKTETKHLVSNLFAGSKLSLVKCLLEDEGLSKEELDGLKKMIEEKL